MNNISISLFKVAPDSKHLNMIFMCPDDYYFNSFLLNVKYFKDGKEKEETYDLTDYLFKDEEGEFIKDRTRWDINLELEKLTIDYPAIYNATITAINDNTLDVLVDKMIASDVNYVYKCMLEEILALGEDPCLEVSDDIIKKYLILYGHQAALSVEDYETAMAYYKLLNNCFRNCGKNSCHTKKDHCKPCNCGRK